MKTRRNAARGWAKAIAAAGVLAMSSGFAMMAATSPAEAAKVHKSYVCKYVQTPGEGEVLQTGGNPIWVDNHALGIDGLASVGDEFKDGQIRSVVIVANTLKLNPEPGIEACTTTPPPGVDLALASATFTDPTCEAPDSGTVETTADAATVVVEPDKASYSIGDSVEVTATADEGAAFAEGATTMWSHTFAASDAPCTVVEPPVIVPPVVDPPVVEPPVVSPPAVSPPAAAPPAVTPPSVVHAGLGSATPIASDAPGQQGLALVLAGMLLLICAGALGTVRPTGAGSRI